MSQCYIGGEIRYKGRLIRIYANRCSFLDDSFTVIKGKPLVLSEKDHKKLIRRVWPKRCGKGSYCVDLDSMQ